MTLLLIHGGAGRREGRHADLAEYASHLRAVVEASYPVLRQRGARAAVIDAVTRLEDDPIFNAGTGSKLQRDGKIRMSAALMDSASRRFCAVINIERVRNPIAVAQRLSDEQNTVLAAAQANAYAHAKGIADYDPLTAHRLREHQLRRAGASATVGAVALDQDGLLCAATSTGGIGYELPGRVSDSATVAGTYVSGAAAVSCTGIGEQIVSHAAAARVVTRIEDGCSLSDALRKTAAEANRQDYFYGLIALDRGGAWGAMQTATVTTLYAVCESGRVSTFLDAGG